MNLSSALDLVLQSTGEEGISHAGYETPLTFPLYHGHTDSERLLTFSSQTPHCISEQPSYKFRTEKKLYIWEWHNFNSYIYLFCSFCFPSSYLQMYILLIMTEFPNNVNSRKS